MRTRKLKSYVMPTIISIVVVALVFTAVLVNNNMKQEKQDETPVLTYVTSSILGNEVAVINTTTKMINPYTD